MAAMNTAVPAVFQAPSFLSADIPMDRVKVPRLSLLQSNSDAVQLLSHTVGTFENSVTGTNHGSTVSLIPIKVGFGAVYMKQGEGLKCKSMDGITSINGDKCAECPFGACWSKWTGADGKTPPECDATVDIICLTMDLEPVVMTFRSTGMREGKKLASALKFNKTLKAFKLTSVREKNDSGTFFVPKVMAFEDVDSMQYDAAVTFRGQVDGGKVVVQETEVAA
jgi:hypothetical protein